ncbi:unnamed protein product [Kluyveromyces dobzhanskii CBS 2104]|uniref:WGS project CCBQ000000000 data, contig 00015 n=1 Tax=Kluyveromyces dobzhanskii CBS 2104 TaxID=1427455 RepID=A0A0A8LCR8_9SACH|nr:unnamed protein product [Kluyveromyces dobzhanskii CBS 2104]
MQDHRGRNAVWFLTIAAVLVTLYSSFFLFWTDHGAVSGGSWNGGRLNQQQQQAAAAAAAAAASAAEALAEARFGAGTVDASVGSVISDGTTGVASKYRQIQRFLFDWRFNTSVFYLRPYTVQTLLARLPSAEEAGTEAETGVEAALSKLKSYDYDPRLSTAVYFDYINDNFEAVAGASAGADGGATLPFNWYDWSDLSSLNDFIDLDPEEKMDCSFVVRKYFPLQQLKKLESKFGKKLFEHDRMKSLGMDAFLDNTKLIDPQTVDPAVNVDEHCVSNQQSAYSPGFMSFKLLNWSRPEVYNLQARSRLYSDPGTQPISITFLSNQSALQIPVSTANSIGEGENWKPNSMLFNGLLGTYLQKTQKTLNLQQEFDPRPIWSQLSSKIESTTSSFGNKLPYRLELNESSFEFNALGRYNELKSLEDSGNLTAHQRHYMDALELSLNTHYIDLPKYFEEASHVTDMAHLGHHYDARFFRGGLDQEEVTARLDSIIRAWLNFAVANDLTTWLAHGTLYGWLYNGLAFTWDGDHDVQMPIRDLNVMAEKFNQSVIVEDPTRGNGRYFLDVGTYITSRGQGNGNNNIDARFIDVDSGLYVDITGLSVSAQPIADRFDWLVNKYHEDLKENPDSLPYYKDPNVVANVSGITVLDRLKYELELNKTEGQLTRSRHEYLSKHIRETTKEKVYLSDKLNDRYNINKHAQAYNCRNRHFQTLFELSPLRLTFFHGVPAYVPNLVLKDLNAEYKVPIENGYQCYEGRCYVPELRAWFPLDKVQRMVKLIEKNPNLKKPLSEKAISKLERNEFELLLMEFSQDPELEPFFIYAVNTFQVGAFRQRELELTYDSKIMGSEKNLFLSEFVKNRYFNPVKKDPFQQSLEASMWNDFIESTDIPYSKIEDLWKQLKSKVARQMLKLNEKYANKKLDWAYEAGSQVPESSFNFNVKGERFFIMGKKWNNRLFVRDPVDLDSSITQQYHLKDEKKYTTKKDAQ